MLVHVRTAYTIHKSIDAWPMRAENAVFEYTWAGSISRGLNVVDKYGY